ncbi:MAG: enoyl-CoA hydratase/isomerase family protein [Actinomycetota bacterium]|nr:enoyl-CoA hydratase/isomerase family protein [Actinomycetota bacterium]
MDEKELLVEERGDIALFILNRPGRRNAPFTSMLVSLALNLEEMEKNGNIRVVVIKGAGDRAFSAGIDFTGLPKGMPEELLERIESKGPLQYTLDAIEASGLPVIAMIRGYILRGGCELSRACDLRVGSEDCMMGMPHALGDRLSAGGAGPVYKKRGSFHHEVALPHRAILQWRGGPAHGPSAFRGAR